MPSVLPVFLFSLVEAVVMSSVLPVFLFSLVEAVVMSSVLPVFLFSLFEAVVMPSVRASLSSCSFWLRLLRCLLCMPVYPLVHFL